MALNSIDIFLGVKQWLFPRKPGVRLKPEDVAAARAYIREYWPKLQRYQPEDDDSLIGVPKPYLVPAYESGHEFDFNEMYYWDSYFMVQGMWHENSGGNQELVEGILEDLCYLFERFEMIPTATRTYFTGRSQPPMLSSFIFDVYYAYDKDRKWLKKHMAVAEREYNIVWMGKNKPNDRQVYQGLSRYYNVDLTHDLAETESGWDYTPRFNRQALDYLPIDLNCLLYKYERDFAETARILQDEAAAQKWENAAESRKKTVNELMWDESRGLFYDYDYTRRKRGSISSVAAYYAMWSGLASEDQAKAMVKALWRFEEKGGLTTTDDIPLNQRVHPGMPVQWAYPNGWAPLHFLTVKGLERYSYTDDAQRIANKWLRTNLDWYLKNGLFLEKYNVVDPEKPPSKGVYPSQTGFGWTNAVFERFCQDYIDGQDSV
jgi:alpha,alpha-trehalase